MDNSLCAKCEYERRMSHEHPCDYCIEWVEGRRNSTEYKPKTKEETMEDKDTVSIDYERAYWQQEMQIKRLTDENSQLREALLKLALRL